MQAGRVHRHRCARLQSRPRAQAQGGRHPHRALRQPVGLGLAREARARRSVAAPTACCACFRWSRAIYARHGIDARFVGHPLADAFALDPDRGAARAPRWACRTTRPSWPCCRAAASAKSAARRRFPRRRRTAARDSCRNFAVVAPMANAACRARSVGQSGTRIGNAGIDQRDRGNSQRVDPDPESRSTATRTRR